MKKKQNYDFKEKANLKQILKKKSPLKVIQWDIAGIDLGSKSHFIATPNPDNEDEILIQEFSTFTSGLQDCIEWLGKCKVRSVVMEATGIYWMHFYTMLESAGFKVVLANARHVKNVKGKKTDVLDAEWLMQLHSYGLLEGAFIPEPQVLELRTYCRLREQSVRMAAQSIQRMQKALIAMNIRLDNVLSDVSGKTGIAMIRSIVNGERDPKVLTKYRDPHCKKTKEEIEEALNGCYRNDLIFALSKALSEWDFHVGNVRDCDKQIFNQLQQFESKMSEEKIKETKKSNDIKIRKKRNKRHERMYEFNFDVRTELMRITGVDIISLSAIRESTALMLISEIGVDMSKWATCKHFSSWAKLSPNNQVSGGRVQRNANKKKATNVSRILRMAVSGLYHESNDSALGVFFRRKKAQKGPKIAITAAANKLAKMLYNLLKTGKNFVEPGAEAYLEMQKKKRINNMRSQLNEWGYSVTKNEEKSQDII